jgi:hypothetical protein
MEADARARLIERVNKRMKMADEVLVRAATVDPDEGRRILAQASDDLDELRYRDGFSVELSSGDEELARLWDELETRKEALHRRLSALSPTPN